MSRRRIGSRSARLVGAKRKLVELAQSARDASRETSNEYLAASLRGKATAYAEAADIVEALITGGAIRKRNRFLWRAERRAAK